MNRSHLCFISLNFWRGTYSEGLRYIILGSRLFVFLNSSYLFMASLNSFAVIVVSVFSMFVFGLFFIFIVFVFVLCVVLIGSHLCFLFLCVSDVCFFYFFIFFYCFFYFF